MGVITGFNLIPDELAHQLTKSSPQLHWLIYGEGAPEDSKLPAGFVRRRSGCDKAWEDMIYVLRAVEYDDVADALDGAKQVDNPWNMWIRFLSASDVRDVRGRLKGLDKAALIERCTRDKVTGYDGEPLDEIGLLEYTVSHLVRLGEWLNKEARDNDALLIAAS